MRKFVFFSMNVRLALLNFERLWFLIIILMLLPQVIGIRPNPCIFCHVVTRQNIQRPSYSFGFSINNTMTNKMRRILIPKVLANLQRMKHIFVKVFKESITFSAQVVWICINVDVFCDFILFVRRKFHYLHCVEVTYEKFFEFFIWDRFVLYVFDDVAALFVIYRLTYIQTVNDKFLLLFKLLTTLSAMIVIIFSRPYDFFCWWINHL